jgi:chlorite dismutase
MADSAREPVPVEPDVMEHGKTPEGGDLTSNRRLTMQLLSFTDCRDLQPLIDFLKQQSWDAVLYQDAADPWGAGLLLMHTDPSFFTDTVYPVLRTSPFADLTPRQDGTLFARAYSIGYEQDLEHTLVARPRQRALNPEHAWAVWYPLRRTGEFAKLPKREKMKILGEHGTIGRAWGEAGYAHDIRLACFGMDRADNDFAVALVGPELLPLSKIVEVMRGTVQTSTYIEKLGPFFVGKAVYQSPVD